MNLTLTRYRLTITSPAGASYWTGTGSWHALIQTAQETLGLDTDLAERRRYDFPLDTIDDDDDRDTALALDNLELPNDEGATAAVRHPNGTTYTLTETPEGTQ